MFWAKNHYAVNLMFDIKDFPQFWDGRGLLGLTKNKFSRLLIWSTMSWLADWSPHTAP